MQKKTLKYKGLRQTRGFDRSVYVIYVKQTKAVSNKFNFNHSITNLQFKNLF